MIAELSTVRWRAERARWLLGVVALGMAFSANAAPILTASPPFQTWKLGAAPLEVSLSSRDDIRILDIRVLDNEGGVLMRRRRFDLVPGPHAFRWDGRLADDSLIATGRYRIQFEALFGDGTREVEEVELRVIPAAKPAPAVEGFAPPVVPYTPPEHRLSGALSYYHRDDRESGALTNEKRVNIHYSDRGERFRFDGVFDFLRRTGPVQNFDNSAAEWRYEWGSGDAAVVFRRSLGDFGDPLRLYADFRAENDKRGFKAGQRFGHGRLTLLHLDGRPVAGGRERANAARWEGRIGERVRYGLAFTSQDKDITRTTTADSTARGVDLAVQAGKAHRLLWQTVATDTDSSDPGVPPGDGTGHRLTWEFTGIAGLDLRAGYLDLSPRYNAALSDPGNQVTGNVEGPEVSADFFIPSAGKWFEGLRVAANAFVYNVAAGGADIDQIDVSTQFKLLGAYQISASVRTRSEAEQRTTSFALSEQHRWSERWNGTLQYNRTKSSGAVTDRLLLNAHTGSARRFHRIGLELLHRDGVNVANGPVSELGLQGSGRIGHWLYEATARRTATKTGGGLNAFGRLAYEAEALHRYVGQIYLALGERAAVRTANRIEVGALLRF